jgi:predicted DNA-binding WGR domain protein
MWMRLEKINPGRRQKRFYLLQVTQTLFGEWCVIREWGRIGNAGGQQRVEYHRSKAQAHAALADIKAAKLRRGYAPIPVQLEMF